MAENNEFPSDEETIGQGEDQSGPEDTEDSIGINNNASPMTTNGRRLKSKASTRAEQFQNMVTMATWENNSDTEEDKQRSEIKEGEASPSDEESEHSFQLVKIIPRSKEEIAREEEEFRKERQGIINQAVDTTLGKLAQFLKNEGLIMTQNVEENEVNNTAK